MPCPSCSHTLVYDEERERLFCPSCLNLPVADKSNIHKKANYIRDKYLNTPELVEIIKEYGSVRVVHRLVQELNEGAAGMTTENRMSFRKFFQALPILLRVYEDLDKFDHHFDPRNNDVQEEVDERIEGILDAGTTLIPVLKQTLEDFAVPIELSPGCGNWTDFYGNYEFRHSEYWFCSERCLQANVGGREELREDFLKQQELLRSFSKPEKDDINSVVDWGDFWYGLIVSLGFSSALDDTVKGAFTTDFPDHVSIFDLEEFLDEIDNVAEPAAIARQSENFVPLFIPKKEFNARGKKVFGDEWSSVRESILVSADSPGAHPMSFEVSGTKPVKLDGWRQPRSMQFTWILYPDQFAQLVKFQLFPFLQNGDMESGVDALGTLTSKRGNEFEENVYEYLSSRDINTNLSCKTAKTNGNEVDVIFIHEDVVYFVELKFVLPTLNMQSQRGINDIDDKFDGLIFKEKTDDGGKPFPEKVEAWLELDDNSQILHQPAPGYDGREWTDLPDEWQELEYQMLVVSNFVPSYLEKQDVRFITDLELYQWIEHGEDVFHDILY